MKVEQIYTGCLAQGAYYIQSEGEAVIIDPLREVTPYIEKAEKDGASIKYVLETHFHADFVSGHVDLAAKTGARIVYGPSANPKFDAYIAKDGEELKVGKLTIKVLQARKKRILVFIGIHRFPICSAIICNQDIRRRS